MDSTHIMQGLITLTGIIAAYLFGRKKNNAEIRKMTASSHVDELSATEKAVSIWRGLAEELRNEVENLRDLVNELKKEIDDLRAQNAALSEEMRMYKSQNHD